ncbi:MAG TPA: hypothetical protein VJB66_02330 [Candidatus Nanoarchaeia archaeon]|nr:hypothetical protein [Candidatus Nanoarchaeia archaeon]
MELVRNEESKLKLLQSELFTSKFSSLVPEGIKQTFEQHDHFLVERETLNKSTIIKSKLPEFHHKNALAPAELRIVKAVLETKPELTISEKMPQQKSAFNIRC